MKIERITLDVLPGTKIDEYDRSQLDLITHNGVPRTKTDLQIITTVIRIYEKKRWFSRKAAVYVATKEWRRPNVWHTLGFEWMVEHINKAARMTVTRDMLKRVEKEVAK